MLDKVLVVNARFLLSSAGFHVAVVGYLLVLFFIRAYLFPGSSNDDAEQLFFAQTFALSYKVNQPPLYNWLMVLAEKLFGVGIAAAEGVKFGCLAATYLFLYQAARLLLSDRRLAALAALSIAGFYYVGWDAILNYTHTVLLAAAVAAGLFALLRVERSGGRAAYVGLGLVIGAGLLAKYNFGLFLVPMTVAALLDPLLRRRLASRRALLTAGIAATLAAPHFAWMAVHPVAFTHAGAWMPSGGAGSTWASGLLSAAQSAISFVLPFALVFALLFPRALLPLPRGAGGAEASRHRRLFEVYFLAVAVLIAVIVVAFGVTRVRTHWMMVLIPFPLYALMRAEAAGIGERAVRWLTGILAAGAIAVIVGVGIRWVSGPWVCRKCNFFIPYAQLAAELRNVGFSGGTIIAADHPNQLAGNLRAYFPDARVLSDRYPDFRPPLPAGAPDACLVVWNTTRPGADREALDFARAAIGVAIPPDPVVSYAKAPIARAGGRTVKLGFVLIANGCH